MSGSVQVLQPGLQSQVQDAGRWGWQAEGVPVGGVMDLWSHRLAQALLGQGEEAASLEILLRGPVLRFEAATCIALAGADLSPRVNGQPVPMHQRLWLAAGAELAFGACRAGLRAYLAVAGGWPVPLVLGSRSTLVRGGWGGFQGRALQAGDALPLPPLPRALVACQPASLATTGWQADPGVGADLLSPVPLPEDPEPPVLAVVEGEHWAHFPAEAQQALLTQRWRVGPQSDRMGYRLQGPALAPATGGERLSEGVAFGTVQVPPDGQPIVLMAERQSTGGYPKIAQVASVDLPRLAQLAPGQALRLARISLSQAQALLEDRARSYQRLRRLLAPGAPAVAAPLEKTP